MAYKTINLGLLIDDEDISRNAADFAVSFCEQEKAHLSVRIGVPIVDLPSNRLVPLLHVVVDEENANRLSKALAERDRIEVLARLAGITIACDIVQSTYIDIRDMLVTTSRVSDLVIIARPTGLLSSEQDLIEAVLFGSGRPTLVVPPLWSREAVFNHIVVAWDGGQYASRAIGDALPLLIKAERVEVICIGPETEKSVAGSDITKHLARHCGAPELTELQIVFDDAGRTLQDHLSTVNPDLLVMGAYAHSRLFQFFLGGVTSLMLSDASLPVFYSH